MQLPFVAHLLLPLALCALPAATVAQGDAPKKLGTIYKDEIDGLIQRLRQSAPESGGFADGSCLRTAQVLTAMGYCHRFYALSDGPVVRDAVRHLFRFRQADGSFAETDAEPRDVTGWVADALEVMDPDAHRDDIAQANRWLQTHGGTFGAGMKWLDAIQTEVAKGRSPVEVGQQFATASDATEPGAMVDALLGLVACQVVAREMDAGKAPQSGSAAFGKAEQQALNFLLAQQQDGVFFVKTGAGEFPDTGVSALALAALQTKPEALRTDEEKAVIDAGLQHLLGEQNDDGSFAQRNANYTTCAAILALAKADRAEFRSALDKAQHYVLAIQNVEDRGYARSDRDYGSIGYGGDQRGDLSNLQFAVEALRASGLGADDEAFVKAMVFLQRTQNLKSVNDFEGRVRTEDGTWERVTSGDDGGAAYYPGNSAAGYVALPDGRRVPRSYGSMTYALLKTYTLAGLQKDDPRVRAAVQWIEKHWTLEENPGSDPSLDDKTRFQGLFYYFMVLAQALDLAGIDRLAVPAADGDSTQAVDWRAALREQLTSLQRDDGSWVNERNGRWWEDQPVICTTYGLLALERTRS